MSANYMRAVTYIRFQFAVVKCDGAVANMQAIQIKNIPMSIIKRSGANPGSLCDGSGAPLAHSWPARSGSLLVGLGTLVACLRPWGALGTSWALVAALGSSWGALGRSWGAPGRSCGARGPLRGRSGTAVGRSYPARGRSWAAGFRSQGALDRSCRLEASFELGELEKT